MKRVINIYQESSDTCILVGRDENGKRIIEKIKHTPYFYVEDEDGKHKGLFGTKLRRIETKSSWDVKKEREKYKKTWESNILFPNRVLIDCIKEIKEAPLKIMYFDIENVGSSDVKNTPVPITCICAHNNFTKKQYGFVWHNDPINKLPPDIAKKIINEVVEKSEKRNTYYFNTEEKMLKKFIKFICAFDFDLFAGWFNEQFDLPYIINRCKKLGIKEIDWISMKGGVSLKKLKNGRWETNIKGRYNFDLLKGYRTDLTFHQMDSYRLNDVARKVLKDEKIKHEPNWENFWNDIPKLLEYCYQDVMLCVRLDEKDGIIKYYDAKRRLIGCQWKDLWNTTRFHDILFLREAKKQGVVLPRKTPKERVKYGGGHVEEPPCGVHENIFVLDLKSLYPNICRTFNLSPETINPSGNIKVKNVIIDENKRGIVPIIYDGLLDVREVVTEKRDKAKAEFGKNSTEYKNLARERYALKVTANKLYGALGTPHFRVFKAEIADAITFLARSIIKYSKEKVEEMGIEVKYGDTDSIFCVVPEKYGNDWDKIEEMGKELGKKLNECYDSFVKKFGVTKQHTLSMEYEKVYEKIFFGIKDSGESAKKRYSAYEMYKDEDGIWKKEFISKGFATIRSDTAEAEQEITKEIHKMLLDGAGKKEVDEYINKLKNEIRNGKYPLDKVALRRGVNAVEKLTIYTEAFRYGNKYLGTNFISGSRIKLLFVKKMPKGYPYPKRGTIAFEYNKQVPEGVIIDWELQFRRIFDLKMERVFRAMGWIKIKRKGELPEGQAKLR